MLKRLLVLAAVGALLCGAAGADTIHNALVAGADNILRYQNPDGGFPWDVDPDGYVPADPSNQATAFVGRGLVAAYKATGLSQYLVAANEAAQFLNDSFGWSNPNKSFMPYDVTFAYELAAAGGDDYVAAAKSAAGVFLGVHVSQFGGTPARALLEHFQQAWKTGHIRTLGHWAQVGALVGTEDLLTGYTGASFAGELNAIIANEAYPFQQGDLADQGLTAEEVDRFLTVDQLGVVLSSSFATGTGGSTDALSELKAKLQSDPSFYFTPRDLGEFTYLLALLGDPDATLGTQLLLDWQNDDGAWLFANKWDAEHQGPALLGLATANPNRPGTSSPPLVPEPATAALFALGMAGMAAVRRKRR